jgi:ligand-binding sensor domain-containing protein/GAF domain-containing protein/two-component sensor histidine kinase
MWFGTQDGLNRYDGYIFIVYRHDPSNPASISSNSINALFQDSKGNLWIGTGGGLELYDHIQNTFIHFKHSETDSSSLSNDNVTSICEDHNGNLWIATKDGGINRYDRARKTFIPFRHKTDNQNSISSDNVYMTFVDKNNNLWIGSWNGDVDIYRIEQNQFIRYPKISNNKKIIRNIIEDSKRNIWICTHGDGLVQMNPDNKGNYQVTRRYKHDKDKINSLSGNDIFTILEDRQGKLWIGTENEGLNLFDSKMKSFIRYRSDIFDKSSLSHNSIWSICEDATGNLWVGTHMGGINLLYRYEAGFLHYYNNPGNPNSISNNSVTSFYEDRQGIFWVGTDGGGLNRFDRKSSKFTCFRMSNSKLSSDAVLSIYEDSRGQFWVGTWGGGLNLFDRNKGQTVYNYTKENNGLSSDYVFSIQEDLQGKLWIGTLWGGVSCLYPAENRFRNYILQNNNLTDNDVRVVVRDIDGCIWIGGGLGLYRMDPKKGSTEKFKYNEIDPNGISEGWVLSILVASDSTLWIGTNGGLNRFNRETRQFTRYYVKDGLPNDVINGIEEDDNGCLWLSTNKGISKFNPKASDFKNYDVSDGLQGNEFYQCSHFKSRRGELFFGGANGFNVLRPKDFTYNSFVPPVYITDFRIFNKPVQISSDSPLKADILQTDSIPLSYTQSVITFEFAALNYISPEKNQYAYQMKNFDHDWNYVGTKRTATYTNLDPGEYIFMVKATNNDGVGNDNVKSIKIIIIQPFWRDSWFRTSIIIIIFLLYYYFRVRIIQAQRKRLHEQVEIIAQIGEDINAKLNIDDILKMMITKIVNQLKCNHCTIFFEKKCKNNEILLVPEITNGDQKVNLKRHFKVKEGIVGWAYYEAGSILSNNVYKDRRFVDTGERKSNFRSMLAVPIKIGDHPIAVICADQDDFGRFTKDDKYSVEVLARQASVAIENARLFGETTRKANALQAIYEAGKAITSTLALEDILKQIIERARLLTSRSGRQVLLIHLGIVEGKKIKYKTWMSSTNPGFTDEIKVIDLEHDKLIGMMGRAVLTGESQNENDVNQNKDYIQTDPNTRSELAVPIKSNKNVIGVINVEHPDYDAYDKDDQFYLELLAAQAAIALDNAKIYNDVKEKREALVRFGNAIASGIPISSGIGEQEEMIYDSIYEQAIKLMNTDDISIAIYDEERDEINFSLAMRKGEKVNVTNTPGWGHRKGKAAGGKTNWVIRNKKELVLRSRKEVDDWYSDPSHKKYIDEPLASWLGVPMLLGERILGVIDIYHLREEHKFSDDDIQIMKALANQAAIAISNARLYKTINQQVEELEKAKDRLIEIDNKVLGGMNDFIVDRFHELGNKLSAIRADIVSVSKSEKSKLFIKSKTVIENAISRCDEFFKIVVQSENMLVQYVTAEKVTLNIKEVIEQTIKEFGQKEENIQIEINIASNLRLIRGNRKRIESMIRELINNSIDAMPNGGIIKIIAHNDDNSVVLIVEDDGTGIPNDIKNSMFNVGHSTKEGHRGLGLFGVYMTVKTHRASISYDSIVNKGTIFRVSFPTVTQVHS